MDKPLNRPVLGIFLLAVVIAIIAFMRISPGNPSGDKSDGKDQKEAGQEIQKDEKGKTSDSGEEENPEEEAREESEKIVFQGTRIASSHSSAVRVEGSRVTILKAGTYVLKGKLSDGQIIVDAGPEDQVVLKLNNLTAHCSDSAPLWIRKAGKVKIRLRDDSENEFSDGHFYRRYDTKEKQAHACIDARCDLNIKGDKGQLTVKASYRDGISSSDDLKIKSGTVKVEAARDALRGKDSLEIEQGDLDLQAGRDGLHSEGILRIRDGSIKIHAG